jgi:hypothetical protein
MGCRGRVRAGPGFMGLKWGGDLGAQQSFLFVTICAIMNATKLRGSWVTWSSSDGHMPLIVSYHSRTPANVYGCLIPNTPKFGGRKSTVFRFCMIPSENGHVFGEFWHETSKKCSKILPTSAGLFTVIRKRRDKACRPLKCSQ